MHNYFLRIAQNVSSIDHVIIYYRESSQWIWMSTSSSRHITPSTHYIQHYQKHIILFKYWRKLPLLQFHHKGIFAWVLQARAAQNHYRYQTASVCSQRDLHFVTQAHTRLASREGSIQWETANKFYIQKIKYSTRYNIWKLVQTCDGIFTVLLNDRC